MATDLGEQQAPDTPALRRRVWIIVGLVFTAIMFFLDDVVGWINGGGLFSIVAASHAIADRARLIDVDESALATIFFVVACLVVMGLCAWFDFRPERRLIQFLTVFAILGGGFVLNHVCGESLINSYMQRQGYSRCPIRDHEVGNGKSRVWFENYVRAAIDCTASLPSSSRR
ncbi:hypothetical protein [Sphingomonas mali]|uniref:hypothetical protein n=1 Tax=Sphingomonas mali TaxID=40682 RepID=UPI00082DC6C2|nr:hypothetical protein [Sphingomonas mali]